MTPNSLTWSWKIEQWLKSKKEERREGEKKEGRREGRKDGRKEEKGRKERKGGRRGREKKHTHTCSDGSWQKGTGTNIKAASGQS